MVIKSPPQEIRRPMGLLAITLRLSVRLYLSVASRATRGLYVNYRTT